MKRKGLAAVIAAGGLMVGAGQASAAFDFTLLPGGNNTALGTSETIGTPPVTATGWVYNGGTSYTATIMWQRDVPNDRGLGVCSEGAGTCSTAGGDYNELDNLGANEVIRLELTDGQKWTSLWVSSLDSGGTGGSEEGTLFFSNDSMLNISAALASGDDALNGIAFSYGDFGTAVQGDLFTLASVTGDANFDPTAKYVYFIAGPSGSNNDYLVWKGDTAPVPIPAALPMLLAAIGGLGFAGWRSDRRPA